MVNHRSADDAPIGVSAQALAELYPRLYHMAEEGAWDGIMRHGLLSTSALLDLFEVSGAKRKQIESERRSESMVVTHPVHGRAVIRDQKPMDDTGLRRALSDGLTPRKWYELLNRHTFFWTSESRLQRLLAAQAYRTRRQLVLTVRTAELLHKHVANVLLSPMNSGATKPFPHPRGRDTFLPLGHYPFEAWRRKRPRGEAVVELLVTRGVPDIRHFVERAEHVGGGGSTEVLFVEATGGRPQVPRSSNSDGGE